MTDVIFFARWRKGGCYLKQSILTLSRFSITKGLCLKQTRCFSPGKTASESSCQQNDISLIMGFPRVENEGDLTRDNPDVLV